MGLAVKVRVHYRRWDVSGSSKKGINTFCLRNSGSKFPSNLKLNSCAKKKKFQITKNGVHLKLKLHQLWRIALSRFLFKQWLLGNNFWISLTVLQLVCYCHSLFRQAHGFVSTHELHQSSQVGFGFVLSCLYKRNSSCSLLWREWYTILSSWAFILYKHPCQGLKF